MELRELIRRFRVEAHDKVEPYFIENEDVIAWLNDAVNEASIRGRLIYENNASITVQTGKSVFSIPKSIYEISRIWFQPVDGSKEVSLKLLSAGELDRIYCDNWASLEGSPCYATQSDNKIRIVPTPNVNGVIKLEGYRTPLNPMASLSDEPEINPIHAPLLIQWVLHKAFAVVDAEFFDQQRSSLAEQAFTDYFGIRPDSDLRRITREDVQHHVQPFMP